MRAADYRKGDPTVNARSVPAVSLAGCCDSAGSEAYKTSVDHPVKNSPRASMTFAIAGMGTAVPASCIDQQDAAEVARIVCCRTPEQAALLPALYRQTGIRQRHMVFGGPVVSDVLEGSAHSGSPFLPRLAEDERGPTTRRRMEYYLREARPLAWRAAAAALAQAQLPPEAIAHLVLVSCTGFAAPGVDVHLIKHLHLAPTVERTHVGFMGCHGGINGLRVAHALAGANPDKAVLLCAVELCSLHYHYQWHPKKMVANALFADGAAAVVGTAAPSSDWRVLATGSCLFPDSEHAMTWHVGDHGFDMTLSSRVPNLIAKHLRPWLDTWLRQHGLARPDIGSWAIHPGGPRILSTVQETLELDDKALATSAEVLAEYGNMSSPTVLFILDRLRRCRASRPCVALAFGPGLVAEAALLS